MYNCKKNTGKLHFEVILLDWLRTTALPLIQFRLSCHPLPSIRYKSPALPFATCHAQPSLHISCHQLPRQLALDSSCGKYLASGIDMEYWTAHI